ncbi:MAG TPA: GNAT family N-acetyltransferase [Longimicrobium sp.]|nr:GNAT family N-acetyltransferase [Longimicrobium sp.]
MAGESGVQVQRNEGEEQFEAMVGGDKAVLTYAEQNGKLYLLHTEVPEAMEGHGIGSALVKRAMEYARETDVKVVPFCPFARAWLNRHPDYAGMVASE